MEATRSTWERITTISTAVIAVTALGGTFLVLQQLKQAQRQNDYLNRTMMQSYRPVGTVRPLKEDGTFGPIVIRYQTSARKDRFSFAYMPKLMNAGQGMLSLVGYVYTLSEGPIEFRKAFLAGFEDSVTFDAIPTHLRRNPVMPGAEFGLLAVFREIPFEKVYYVCMLIFYEDQDGNLFDTEYKVELRFAEPEPTAEGLKPRLDHAADVDVMEKYSQYSQEDRRKLVARFRDLNHPLAGVIAGE